LIEVHVLQGWEDTPLWCQGVRLAKFLSSNGVASRREAERIIRARRVTINGELANDPARDVGPDDRVALDGRGVVLQHERVVYAVNKPAGVVSTARDTHGRPTVVSLVPSPVRLYPVGRLDIDTTGLILLTNDGELANRLTHPRFGVPRTYRARLTRAPVASQTLERLRRGITLEDGITAPARVRRVAPDTIELTIHEGRNRQVRRMCEAVGHRVISLQRVGFGTLRLGGLEPGAHRRLTSEELRRLSISVAAAARREPGASSATPARRRARSTSPAAGRRGASP
jgi:23S rRNA pseudouridine2605 synthase